jgi:hypothetical protein
MSSHRIISDYATGYSYFCSKYWRTWIVIEITAAIDTWFSNFREHRFAPLGIRLWLVKFSSLALLQPGIMKLNSPFEGIFGTAQAQEYFSTFFHPSTPILGAIISTVS